MGTLAYILTKMPYIGKSVVFGRLPSALTDRGRKSLFRFSGAGGRGNQCSEDCLIEVQGGAIHKPGGNSVVDTEMKGFSMESSLIPRSLVWWRIRDCSYTLTPGIPAEPARSRERGPGMWATTDLGSNPVLIPYPEDLGMVEDKGFEPLTPRLPAWCSPS